MCDVTTAPKSPFLNVIIGMGNRDGWPYLNYVLNRSGHSNDVLKLVVDHNFSGQHRMCYINYESLN